MITHRLHKSMSKHALLCVLLLSGIQCAKIFAPPLNYIVTTNADAGAGSLRDGINATNANVGFTNTITFSAPFLITPATTLPIITNPLVIDGYAGSPGGATPNVNPITAPNTAVITVQLQGPGAGVGSPVVDGLILGAGSSGSTIRGLSITNFATVLFPGTVYGAGIRILSNNNIIEGNFVGADTTGFNSGPNATAINVFGDDNLIGGTTPAARNLLSGHYLGGSDEISRINGVLRIQGSRTVVQQNTVGLNRTGAAVLMPDSHQGVVLIQTGLNGGNTLIGGPSHLVNGNVISGHRAANIVVDLIVATNIIQQNYVGLNVAGTAAITGNGIGVAFLRGGRGSIDFAELPINSVINSNVISGNTYGVVMGENSTGRLPLFNSQITFNFIGLNAAGTAAIPNSLDGIWMKYTINSFIGFNTISGNGRNGIRIGKAKNTIINGNFIGVADNGTTPIPNGANGIQLGTVVASGVPAFGDMIGRNRTGDGNLIANNGGNGIEIVSYTQEETIIGNTIINNALDGIALDPNSSHNWIGGFRSAGDLRLMGGTNAQGATNLGPLGISNRISGNGDEGISATGSNANTIQANFITGNGGNGITLTNSSDNLVGGLYGSAATTTPPTLGNIIQTNSGFGVEVAQAGGTGVNAVNNSILSNSICNNTSRGIALVTE